MTVWFYQYFLKGYFFQIKNFLHLLIVVFPNLHDFLNQNTWKFKKYIKNNHKVG